MHGAISVNDQIKSISAVKPKREGGHARAKKRRGGENIMWRRITANFDDAVRRAGADPRIGVPLTRLVLFKHLTTTQGMAGRRYADVVRKFERYHMAPMARNGRSANLEPTTKGEDDEIERRIKRGTIAEYEADARMAKRQYKRAMKVLGQFADPISGRNFAKDVLDNLCLSDIEPPSASRASIGVVLTMLAKEFGIGERR